MSIQSIPKFLYHNHIYGLIEQLVIDGATSYQSISDEDKEMILVQIIRVQGDEASELIDTLEILSHFSKFLQSSTREDAYDLADKMREKAREVYSKPLDELFNQVSQMVFNDRQEQMGMVPFLNAQTGETEWRKTA